MDRVVEISTIKPEWDDIVVIKVNYSNLPAKAKRDYAESVRKIASELFPNNKIAIIGTDTEISLEKDTVDK